MYALFQCRHKTFGEHQIWIQESIVIKRVVERQVISEFQPLGRNLDKTQPSWLIVCSEIERSR